VDARKDETRREYEHRIERATRYIALHLREDLALSDIATESAFSEFHFHRIFSAITGETVARYVRRLRLEMAANRFQHDPGSTVTTIGMECGFNNPAVFSRAFKERFGVTPDLYRKGRRSVKREKTGRFGRPFSRRSVERVSVAVFPPERILVLSRVGPYDKSLISFYRKVERRTRSMRAAGSFRMIGITLDNPHITPRNLCRYELGVAVPEGVEALAEGEIRFFSPGTTALYPFEGMPFLLERGFDDLYIYWLPESGYQPAEAPAFIVHRDDRFFSGLFRKTRIDVCLPVKPL
jgi:AraC family transcriptional regulator